MSLDRKDFSPGLVLIPSSDLTRYATFSISLLSTAIPPGSQIAWTRGIGVARNLNVALRSEFTPELTWVWILGDDHAWQPDLLLRLLSHNVPIVAPVCARRKPPLTPLVFTEGVTQGEFWPYQWFKLPTQGRISVDMCSLAGMVVRREVIEAIGDPWFELGQTKTDAMGEDLYFCQKARAKGYQILVDTEAVIGHCSPVCYYPEKRDGKWVVRLELDEGTSIILDASTVTEIQETRKATIPVC